MSENRTYYDVKREKPLSISVLKKRACCRSWADPMYLPPEKDEIDAVIAHAGWSQQEFAETIGVSTHNYSSSTIRRWKAKPGSKSYREIPYASWRLALYEANVISPSN